MTTTELPCTCVAFLENGDVAAFLLFKELCVLDSCAGGPTISRDDRQFIHAIIYSRSLIRPSLEILTQYDERTLDTACADLPRLPKNQDASRFLRSVRMLGCWSDITCIMQT